MSPPTPYNPPPPETLKTIFEDEAIIVADKPSGLLSVPGIGPEKAVCANSVLSDRHGPVLTVHRLDMDTSGLIIFARDKAAQRALSRGFERRQVDKTYQALVEGCVEGKSGIIDKAIAKFSHQRPLRHLDPEGQSAITHWTVLDRTEGITRMSLQPQNRSVSSATLTYDELGSSHSWRRFLWRSKHARAPVFTCRVAQFLSSCFGEVDKLRNGNAILSSEYFVRSQRCHICVNVQM